MKHIVLIGNSPAAVKAIRELQTANPDLSFTIVTDGFYPYSREQLGAYLSKSIKEKQTLCEPEHFYKDHKIRVIADQTIARFNFKRNLVVFENKEQLEYDALVLADLGTPRLPNIKGHHKQGVYNAVRLKDVKAVAEQVPFIETTVVQLTSLNGFAMLCALSSLGKEVVACMPSTSLLNGFLDQESASLLKQLLEQNGVRLMAENPIEEILGDTDVKAVRLKSGKVFATDLVVLDDLRLDTRVIKESGLQLAQPHDTLQANFANVYLVDAFLNAFRHQDANDYGTPETVQAQQGVDLARQLLGRSGPAVDYIEVRRFKFKGVHGFWAGQPRLLDGGREFLHFESQTNVYKKIFTDGSAVTGAVFFNASGEEYVRVRSAIEQKTNIQGLEERLLATGFEIPELSKSSA